MAERNGPDYGCAALLKRNRSASTVDPHHTRAAATISPSYFAPLSTKTTLAKHVLTVTHGRLPAVFSLCAWTNSFGVFPISLWGSLSGPRPYLNSTPLNSTEIRRRVALETIYWLRDGSKEHSLGLVALTKAWFQAAEGHSPWFHQRGRDGK